MVGQYNTAEANSKKKEEEMMDFDYVMAFLKAKRDAPNYREATDKEMKAKKTVAHVRRDSKTGYCKWYDFICKADHICDAWVRKE